MLNEKWITKDQNTRLYQIPVPIIGLTGGIATGKSAVARFFAEKNIPVIDADKLVKNIYQKKETIEFVKNNYSEVIEKDMIVFPRLRELAFTRPAVKKKLEDFIYAILPSEFKKAFQAFSSPSFIVYDVPLLFEKGLDQHIDASICVYIPRPIQIKRLIKRDSIDQNLAEKILNQQMDIDAKKARADFVIDNTGTLEKTREEFEVLFSKLTS